METLNMIFDFIYQILSYQMEGVLRADPLSMGIYAAGQVISTGIDYFGNQSSITEQQRQYDAQVKAREQEMKDRMASSQYLSGEMPNEDYFSQFGITPEYLRGIYDPSQLNSAYDPNKLKEIYAGQRQLLGQQQAMQTSQAQSTAGAQAASRGMANPTAFTQQAVQPIQQAFAQQIGQLGARENEALYNLGVDRFSQEQRMREGGMGQLFNLAKLRQDQSQNRFSNKFDIEKFKRFYGG